MTQHIRATQSCRLCVPQTACLLRCAELCSRLCGAPLEHGLSKGACKRLHHSRTPTLGRAGMMPRLAQSPWFSLPPPKMWEAAAAPDELSLTWLGSLCLPAPFPFFTVLCLLFCASDSISPAKQETSCCVEGGKKPAREEQWKLFFLASRWLKGALSLSRGLWERSALTSELIFSLAQVLCSSCASHQVLTDRFPVSLCAPGKGAFAPCGTGTFSAGCAFWVGTGSIPWGAKAPSSPASFRFLFTTFP